MKALVTGCAGFIGSHLSDHLLSRGFKVMGVDCFTDYYPKKMKEQNVESSLSHDNFTFIEDDLSLMDSFPLVDYVFHLAAQAGVRDSWGKNFHIYTKNNIEATQHLLEFYKDFKPRKFIYSSSSSVYGNADLPMNEDAIPKPISPYGVTKLAAEHLCYLYWKNYGIPTISLRYFTVYGPRQRPDMAINKFVYSIFNNEMITIFGDGKQTRDFTYVDDVVKAIMLASENDAEWGVYNVGGGSRISVNELIKEIEIISGKKARLNYTEKQKGDVMDTCADLTKNSRELGWEPNVSIKTGLKNYIKWYKKFYKF